MDFGIKGKKALIFGGSKGLGRGTAEALAAEGVDVALVARDREGLDEATKSLRVRYGIFAEGFSADLFDASAIAAAVDAATAALGGRIDILLNNTGGPPPSAIVGIDPMLWRDHFDAMVLRVIETTDRIVPGMRDRGWGRVLTVAGTVVEQPNPALAMSNTLRATLTGWSKTLAGEVAGAAVTVNLLLPGQIATARTLFLDETAAERQGKTAEAIKAQKLTAIPAGRYGTPEEFGAIAAFLCSEQAAYITGSMIRVDGGCVRAI